MYSQARANTKPTTDSLHYFSIHYLFIFMLEYPFSIECVKLGKPNFFTDFEFSYFVFYSHFTNITLI